MKQERIKILVNLKMEERKKTSLVNDIKNLSKNFNTLKSTPLGILHIKYLVARSIIVFIMLFVAYQMIMIILQFKGGSSSNALIGRIGIFCLLVLILIKFWSLLKPFKDEIDKYNKMKGGNDAMGRKKKIEAISGNKISKLEEIGAEEVIQEKQVSIPMVDNSIDLLEHMESRITDLEERLRDIESKIFRLTK
jgi:hypothetical protein